MEGRLSVIVGSLLLGLCGCQNRSQSVVSNSPAPPPGLASNFQKPPPGPMPLTAQAESPPDDGKRAPRDLKQALTWFEHGRGRRPRGQ